MQKKVDDANDRITALTDASGAPFDPTASTSKKRKLAPTLSECSLPDDLKARGPSTAAPDGSATAAPSGGAAP
eukprot:7468037-Pyramimonas_sp.AAC.1